MAVSRVEPLLGCQRPRTEKLIVKTDDGAELVVLVRQPTVAGRQRIFKAASLGRDGASAKTDALAVQSALECVVREDGKPRFTEHDREALENEPAGGWLDAVRDLVQAMMVPRAVAAKCIGCGGDLPEAARFCPACGLGVQPGGEPPADPSSPSAGG